MDVLTFACPVRKEDKPTEVSIVSRPCGYSHNFLRVQQLDVQGVVEPPWDVGVCVRPIGHEPVDQRELFTWLEYMRMLGVGHVVLYISKETTELRQLLKYYENEVLKLVKVVKWNVMEENLETMVSSEAAVNHCIYTNMMKFKYIVVTSVNHWPSFGPHRNYKQLVRDQTFLKKVTTFGGFRLKHCLEDDHGGSRKDFIVKSRRVLATAAEYFVALSSTPYFRMLNQKEICMMNKHEIETNPSFITNKEGLDTIVAKRIAQVLK